MTAQPRRHRRILAGLAVPAVLALAACSSPAPPASGTGASAIPQDSAANPVPILKLTGCPVPASEKYGTIGVDEDRVGHCAFPGGEEVWVFTYPSVTYRDNRLAHPLAPPSDGSFTIRGPGASIIDVDTTGGSGPSPGLIASHVHGTLAAQTAG